MKHYILRLPLSAGQGVRPNPEVVGECETRLQAVEFIEQRDPSRHEYAIVQTVELWEPKTIWQRRRITE